MSKAQELRAKRNKEKEAAEKKKKELEELK